MSYIFASSDKLYYFCDCYHCYNDIAWSREGSVDTKAVLTFNFDFYDEDDDDDDNSEDEDEYEVDVGGTLEMA